MVNAPSRGNALGVWKMATLVPTAPDEALEFYLNNGPASDKLKEDRPGGSTPHYVMPFPGSFKLMSGIVRPFPRGSEARIMLVSDIDGERARARAVASERAAAKPLCMWCMPPSLGAALLVRSGQVTSRLARTGAMHDVPYTSCMGACLLWHAFLVPRLAG